MTIGRFFFSLAVLISALLGSQWEAYATKDSYGESSSRLAYIRLPSSPRTSPSAKRPTDYFQESKEVGFRESIVSRQTMLSVRGGGTHIAIQAANWIGKSKARCWVTLLMSIVVEALAASLSKKAKIAKSGRLFFTALSMYAAAICGFTTSLEQIDVSLAYAMWSAVGTMIVTTAGVILYGEAMNPPKLISLLVIIGGVIGLNLSQR